MGIRWGYGRAADVSAKLAGDRCRTEGKLPATYVFQTREGGSGLLQITGFAHKPPGVTIRYKLAPTAAGGR